MNASAALTNGLEDLLQLRNSDEAGIVFIELIEDISPRHKLHPQLLKLFNFKHSGPVVLATVVNDNTDQYI